MNHDMSSMDMGGDSSSSSSSMGHSMPMAFTNDHSTPLFSAQWTPSTTGGYAGTCIFLIVLAIISRMLVAYRSVLETKWRDLAINRRYITVAGDNPADRERQAAPAQEKNDEATLTVRGLDERVKVIRTPARAGISITPWRFSTDLPRACIYTVQAGVGYLLMLAVMTLNVGYFIDLIYGEGHATQPKLCTQLPHVLSLQTCRYSLPLTMPVLSYTILGLAATALALPQPFAHLLSKRQTLSSFSDVDILNYALTLEHLEATFYREGLAKFSSADSATAGAPAAAYARLTEVAGHEKAHVDFLAGALGSAATAECTYAFPLSSVAEFLGTASVLEGVGVSAYLGAARQIANKDYLTAAGSILTIESRHAACLRDVSSQSKLSPFPTAQDVGLSPNAIFTLASGFITACPSTNPALPVKPFPALAATTPGTVTAGSTVEVKTAGTVLTAGSGSAKLYAAFVTASGPVWADLQENGDGVGFKVKVPSEGVRGQSYLVLCNCKERVDDGTIVAGPAILEVVAAA
ncbi:hypothetical protein Q7P37_001888 [Cladosporium fusiforme]